MCQPLVRLQCVLFDRNYHAACADQSLGSLISRHDGQTASQILLAAAQTSAVVAGPLQYQPHDAVSSLVLAATGGFDFHGDGPLLRPMHNNFCSWCTNAFVAYIDSTFSESEEDAAKGGVEECDDDNSLDLGSACTSDYDGDAGAAATHDT